MLKRRGTRLAVVLLVVALAAAALADSGSAQRRKPPRTGRTPSGPTYDGCKSVRTNGRDARGVRRGSANPLEGLDFFVDPEEPADRDFLRYLRRHQKRRAKQLFKLAVAPKFRWLGRFTSMAYIRDFLDTATCAGAVPQAVVLRAQGQRCNPHYTAGGRAEDKRTRRWYRKFAHVVGRKRIVIAFEPDSIGTIDCLARSRRRSRVALLRYGVRVLSKIPNATIYLEGTASDWKSPRFTARMLRRIGIARVRGFMLNATHYDWTAANIRYGRAVSRRVGGKPFVINTAENGRGPVHYTAGNGRRINVYCNPQFRGLGPSPTTKTHYRRVDAFLYINRPGVSGAGGCNGAPRHAGTWWPKRALMFGKYATQWLRPKRGTRFGFRRRISLCRLGAPVAAGRYSNTSPARRCRR